MSSWRAGVAYGYVASRLRFSDGAGGTVEPDLFKQAVTASLEKRVTDKLTLQLGAGATLAGELRVGGDAFSIGVGPLASFAAAYRFVDEKVNRPFVIGSASLGASYATTHVRDGNGDAGASFVATDGRIGISAGKTIADTVSVYAAARAFGLPVFWSYRGADVTGSDIHHYQLAAGFVLRLGRFDASLELAPLGERAIVGGLGVGF